jgi:ribosomal-protein-alanine N-acetyltransferase
LTTWNDSAVLVTPFESPDKAAVELIAHLGGQDIDVDAELGRDWSRIWVARPEAGARPVGVLLAWSVVDELHVINVATHPDFRRRGVARALLSTAVERAVHGGARLVLLEVRRSNRAAIELYRGQGFSVMGVRRAYYSDNSEDAIEMMLAIDPATGRPLPGRDELDLGRPE